MAVRKIPLGVSVRCRIPPARCLNQGRCTATGRRHLCVGLTEPGSCLGVWG